MEDEGLEITRGGSQYSCQQALRQFYNEKGIPDNLEPAEREAAEKHALGSYLGKGERETREKPRWELEQELLQSKGLLRIDPTQIPFQ